MNTKMTGFRYLKIYIFLQCNALNKCALDKSSQKGYHDEMHHPNY